MTSTPDIHLSLNGTKRWMRPVAMIARADNHMQIAPATSFRSGDIWPLFKTPQSMHRAVTKLETGIGLIASTGDDAYGWTPMGRAIGMAIRSAPDFEAQFMFRLSALLEHMPQEIIVWLCSLPRDDTVPEGLAILAEFELILKRTQTHKWGLRRLTAGHLIQFFEDHPNRTPHPSQLIPPNSSRVDDQAAHDRLRSAIGRIYSDHHGSEFEIDPAEFNWEYDVNRLLLG